jgi:MarR family transcriptional regulator for hemolysin
VDRSVKAGIVARQTSKNDRRVKRVVYTEDGHRLYVTVGAVTAGVRKELLVHIDPKTLPPATKLLETLQELIAGVS